MKANTLSIYFVLVMLTTLCLKSCRKDNYTDAIQSNWNISLPNGYSMVYEADSGASFHGDGIRYHVIEYNNTATAAEALSWSDKSKQTVYTGSYENAASQFLDELEVPAKERFDFESCPRWYDCKDGNNEIMIFYEADTSRLYIIESFF